MTIYFHIGTQKTGSTAIQKFLHDSSRALYSKGVLYPTTPDCDRNKVSHYNSVRGLFSDSHADREYTSSFFSSSFNSSHEKVIISAENLSNWPNNKRTSTEKDYFEHKIKSLQKLKDYSKDREVVVLMFVRPVEEYLKSLFNQHLKVNRNVSRSIDESLELFLDREIIRSDFNKEADVWRRVFGNIKVLDYDKTKKSGLIETFVRSINLDLPVTGQLRQNVSSDWASLEIRRISLLFGSEYRPTLEEDKRLKLNDAIEAYVSEVINSRCKKHGLL